MKQERMFGRKVSRTAAALAACALSTGLVSLVGCSGGTGAGPGGSQAKGFVAILPGPTQVGVGGSLQIFAEASPSSVTWTLTPVSGCSGNGCGTLTSPTAVSVTYVSPSSLSGSTATFKVTATSTIDPTLTASETLTIFPVAVVVTGPVPPVVLPSTSAALAAVVNGDPTGNGVSWSVSGANCSGVGAGATNCGTLTNVTTNSVTFTAPAATTPETILVTATSIAFPGASASFTVTLPKSTQFTYTPANLPPAIAGQPYSATVQVSAKAGYPSTAPYTFLAQNLPSWATLTPASPTTGTAFTISGTPPAGTQGTTYLQVLTTDSAAFADEGSQSFGLAVYPAAATGNNLLTGSYAFYATGWLDTTTIGSTTSTAYEGVSYIGSFTADGKGNITGGEMDRMDFQNGLTSYSSLSGSYNIQYATADGTPTGTPLANFQSGYITLLLPGNAKPVTLAVTFRSIQHPTGSTLTNDVASFGDFIEFDDTTGVGVPVTSNSSGQRLQGTLALQQPTVLSKLASPLLGSFAFGMNGNTSAASTAPINGDYTSCFKTAPPTCGPVSLAGVFNIGANGAITNGQEDVMVASNYFAASANSLTGSLANGGATDASGRVAASIAQSQKYTITVSSVSTTTTWPSNFIVYAIDPQHFYFMSADSYVNYASLIGSSTMQQPTVTTGAAPLSTSNPMALMATVTSTQYFTNGSGPNGKVRVQIQLVTPVKAASGCTAAEYGLSGVNYQDLSGTITTAQVGSVGTWCNDLSANGRLAPTATTTGQGEPILYLFDTNQGYGTQWNTGNGPGTWLALNRTSPSLNAGTYSGTLFNPTSITGPLEVMSLTLPKGGVPNGTTAAGAVSFTGTDYSQFPSVLGEYPGSGAITFTGPYTGTMANNQSSTVNGVVYTGILPQKFGTASAPAIMFNPTNQFQGCISGFGFVISPTAFVCFATVDQFANPHLFQQ